MTAPNRPERVMGIYSTVFGEWRFDPHSQRAIATAVHYKWPHETYVPQSELDASRAHNRELLDRIATLSQELGEAEEDARINAQDAEHFYRLTHDRTKERDAALAGIKRLRETCFAAKSFIENGIEFGFIRMPDKDTEDSAHMTLPRLRAALNPEKSDE